jgi:hypothetical protein
MPSERQTSFIGICVRTSDAAAFLDVRLQRHGAAIRDVSGSSRLLFPPRGEVEIARTSAALSVGDWVAFEVVSDAPQGASVLRVVEYRRLLPLEDLTELGSSEAVRRLLVEDGRANGVPGEVMIRVGERELVRIELVCEPDGRWRAAASEELRRLPVWRFDPKLCLSVSDAAHGMTVVDPSERFVQIGTLDWSRDADFVRRIIRSLTRVEAGEDEALRRFAEALGRFAAGLERGGAPKSADPRIAQEILRIRNLAALLRDEQDLLRGYYEALRNDAEVKSLLEAEVSAIARQTVEAERRILLDKLSVELEQDLAALRAQREVEIRRSGQEFGSEMARALERHRAADIAELEVALAERERQGREELEATLGAQRSALDAEVSKLEDQRGALFKQVELLGQRERELSASLEALTARETSVLENLERFRVEREAEIRKSAEAIGARLTGDFERRIAQKSAEFAAALAERERQGNEALEASLGARRAALQTTVAKLEDRHVVLGNAIELLERRERELTASVDSLSFKEASALDAIELRKAEREAEIKKSIEILSTGMMSDLERRGAARTAELEAELAERERQAHEALETSLGNKRAGLEAEVSALDERQTALGREIEQLQKRAGELAASVDGLAAREARGLEEIEQRRTEREAEIKRSVESLSAGMIGDLERRLAARTAEFEAALVDREKQAHDALDASLGARRSELRAEVSELQERQAALTKEIEALEHRERELAASLEELSSREASAVQSVARLSRRIIEETPGRGPGPAAPLAGPLSPAGRGTGTG